jgi:hypothetical protein
MLNHTSTKYNGSALVGTSSGDSQDQSTSTTVIKRKVKPSSTINATSLLVAKASQTKNNSNTVNIWEEVLKEHLQKLNVRDRGFCLHVRCNATLDQDTLGALFEPLRAKYDKCLFQRLLERISPVLSHIRSFGMAIDAVVGHGSIAAGFIWGGIRILLEV